MKPPDAIKLFWDSSANWYASHMLPTTSKFYSAILPFMHIIPQASILEAACGAGNGLELLLDAEPLAEITGTDLSDVMIDLAREKLGNKVRLKVGDNEHLPFAAKSFTHYISNLSLHIVPHPDKMLAEAYRVLKPGGFCAVSVIGYDSSYMKLNMKALGLASLIESSEHDYLKMANSEVVLHLIEVAGFKTTLRFTEYFNYPIWLPAEAAEFICNNPGIEALKATDLFLYDTIKSKILEDCKNALSVEKQPLKFQCDIYVSKKA
mmetsp:Transcript_11198/g.22034  ORF Transcript_11198/g.22034 Transcript_11198/m.22034 type:complete len:264 (+) Transcript_11198:704-1495(+)